MSCRSPVNDEYPTTRRISSFTTHLGPNLHVEWFLCHNRVSTVKQMPVIRDITAAVYRLFGISQRMEQGQAAVRWSSRASHG